MSYDDWKTGGDTGGLSEAQQEAEALARYQEELEEQRLEEEANFIEDECDAE